MLLEIGIGIETGAVGKDLHKDPIPNSIPISRGSIILHRKNLPLLRRSRPL